MPEMVLKFIIAQARKSRVGSSEREYAHLMDHLEFMMDYTMKIMSMLVAKIHLIAAMVAIPVAIMLTL